VATSCTRVVLVSYKSMINPISHRTMYHMVWNLGSAGAMPVAEMAPHSGKSHAVPTSTHAAVAEADRIMVSA